MSASQCPLCGSLLKEPPPPRWFFGIPWTSQDLRNALDQAQPTTAEERRWCELAKADKNDYPSALFFWAREDIGTTIDKELSRAYFKDARDPVTNARALVMVLSTKSGAVSESDLDESPDLDMSLATDAEVAELRRKGWVVRWYREDKDSRN